MIPTAYRTAATKPRILPRTQTRTRAGQTPRKPRLALHAGFSLVEVMVAMVIGLLGIIVMMQVFSAVEKQKRTTTGGDDAINSGSIALYGVERDIRQSGWGINALPLIGCSVSGLAVGVSIPLVPVTINSALITGQDDNTDTLLVISGNGNGTVEGDFIVSQGGDNFGVQTLKAFNPPDRVVATPSTRPAPCSLASYTVAPITGSTVALTTTITDPTVMTNGKLYNLGANPFIRAYAIRNGTLTMCNYRTADCGAAANNTDPAIWVPIANGVISLRAQYGRDTATAAMDGIADVWDQAVATTATPVSTDGTKNTNACGLLRVSALRIALAARSNQPERTLDWPALTLHVTTPQTIDVASSTTTPLPWAGSSQVAFTINATEAGNVQIVPASPDATATWPTWQDFRYKVFQTVVPLRNITSMGMVDGC